MRGTILALAGGAACLILGASDGYAGAVKLNCTTGAPPPCVINGPGSGTTTVDPSEDPSGTQNGPVGTIQVPDSTFGGDGAIDHGTQAAGGLQPTTISQFLGIPDNNFSTPADGGLSPDDVVYEFDGSFAADTDVSVLSITVNTGDALSQIQVYINGFSTPLIDTVANPGCSDPTTAPNGATDCTYTARIVGHDSPDTFVLDYYTGTGDSPFIDATVNGTPLVDGVPEPAALSLFGAALLGFGILRRRKRG